MEDDEYVEINDNFEEEEELDEELDEEEEEEEEIIDDFEEEELEEPYENAVLKKIDENDNNHKMIEIRPFEKNITSNVIHYSEMVEAIAARASQIENGSRVFTDVSGLTSPIDMATKEFMDRKNPFILERHVKKTNSSIIVEHWKVREMTFPITEAEVTQLTNEINQKLLSKK